MHRLAIAAASLIAATALVGGCEQDSTTQPEPEVVATAAVPEPTPAPEPEPERTEYFTLLALCESGDATPERIQEFLDLRAEVNARAEYGQTPLHYAARSNENPEVVTTLIKAGAEVNARADNGGTPLHGAAAHNENPEVITTLIKAGAEVNARDEEGETPLDVAEGFGRWKNFEVLRAAGLKRGKDLP